VGPDPIEHICYAPLRSCLELEKFHLKTYAKYKNRNGLNLE